MKNSFIISFVILVTLAVATTSQSTYDPSITYNFTWLQNYPYNMSKLQLCEIPSTDGTYCQKCLYNISRWDFNGPGYCTLDFPVDYCYAYDWVLNCLLCHDGYWLKIIPNDIYRCIPKTLGCLNYDTNSKKCITCQAGWSMNASVNSISNLTEYFCFFVADANCLKYDSNNVCLNCATNYVLANNKCNYWIPNCDTMSGTVCSKCKTNYQLDTKGNCVDIPKVLNCALQIDFACQSCVTGYSLSNNQCTFIIQNCAKVNGLICSQCNTGYSITSDGQCAAIPKISNCFNQVDFTCQSCVTGYSLLINQCIYIIDNCAQVNGMVCSKCISDFYITTDGKCAAIPKVPNCASQLDFTCQSCISGYSLSNNQCIFIIDNCASVNGMVCSKCNTGYYITTDGKCSSIPKISNCASQFDFTCQQCLTGYSLSNNQCVYIIDNCAQVNGMVCSECNTGYTVSIDGKCAIIPKVANCASQVNFTCQSCVAGYSLSNNQCIYIIDNCAQINGIVCSKCNTGFSITSDGKCVSIPLISNCAAQIDFTCQACNSGFVLSSNQCIGAIPNCIQFSGANCTKCSSEYTLAPSGNCVLMPKVSNCDTQIATICTKCITGYNLISNLCVYHINNCLKVSGTTCTQCADGYVVGTTGQCSIIDPFAGFDPNCKLFDLSTFNKCLSCSGGFFLNTKGQCEQVDPLCKSYNGSNGFCLSCYIGFNLDLTRGKCIKLTIADAATDNCNQYDFIKNVCVKCAEGCYFDSNGKCQKYTDVNCKIPSVDLKTCSQCYQGYSFDATQGKCIVANLHCATWANGKCATCPQGYYLDTAYNCVLADPFCKIFNPAAKICVLCYPGYTLDVDKKCKQTALASSAVTKYSLNCAKYNDKGQCTDCYFGYYVITDNIGPYCEKVSDLCRTYDKANGKCTSCYLGYYLSTLGDCLRYF